MKMGEAGSLVPGGAFPSPRGKRPGGLVARVVVVVVGGVGGLLLLAVGEAGLLETPHLQPGMVAPPLCWTCNPHDDGTLVAAVLVLVLVASLHARERRAQEGNPCLSVPVRWKKHVQRTERSRKDKQPTPRLQTSCPS